MAKGWLTKLRCMMKRWHSSRRIACAPSPSPGEDDGAPFHGADEVPKGLRPLYVGRSRRQYLVAEELAKHTLFHAVVGCEVMLFEHLLWMLKNGDPQPESHDDLVDFYAC